MTASHDIPTVNWLLAERMTELAQKLAGEPTSRSRDEWRFRSKGSLAVIVAGPKRGSWHDYEAGTSGDPLGLVAHLLRNPKRDAYAWALAFLGDAWAPMPPAPSTQPVAPSKAAPAASAGADPILPLSARIHIAAPQISMQAPDCVRASTPCLPVKIVKARARVLLVYHAQEFSPALRAFLVSLLTIRTPLGPVATRNLEAMWQRAAERLNGEPHA
ncbi:hypothetical protein [Falsiroseomonas selenitidurans]|uniref:Uncharacterized protein n=1 Tax=Falsiroseomonas selenitidurans TaxID=2716335 RepID=A0ABX1EEQ5_9PROT|nr:hypothetical protein [Falsiroseomonas selenitidurans]NKC33385.1 hypothetical protein [Falsiroseomonas selenitidurans]